MEKYTIETSGKKITNLSAEDVVKHYQNKVTTELIGSLASTEYPETFADAEEVAQDFGDAVTKVEPTKDNAEEGGKVEFADGDESAQNFNGCPDCDKMLSKASKNEFVAATPNDYKKFKRFVKRNEWSFPYVEKDDITLLVKPHSDKYNYTLYAFQIKDDKSFGIAGEDNKYYDGFLESRGAHSLKDVFRDINEWWNDNDPELSHFLEEYPDFQEVSESDFNLWEPETSAEKEEVVVIDLDGKVLSWVDDEHVDFLDTVDEPDGGKAKAVRFEDEIDVKETMETVGYPDEEYEILPVSEAFAFVEEGEE